MTQAAPAPLRPSYLNALAGIVAGFSTRTGGTSTAPYDSLNLGLSTSDEADHVLTNRQRLCEAVGFDGGQMAIAGQVHGSAVLAVSEPGLYPGYDGLVTATPELLLCISAADCASVLLADAKNRVIGACHSGWRGTVANISQETIQAMQAHGAEPTHIHGYISPCISVTHFEVGEEVAAHFDDSFVVRAPGTKPHVNLKAALAAQMQQAGIPPSQIHVSHHCTYAETDLFFSYRAEQGTTGRMMGVIGLSTHA